VRIITACSPWTPRAWADDIHLVAVPPPWLYRTPTFANDPDYALTDSDKAVQELELFFKSGENSCGRYLQGLQQEVLLEFICPEGYLSELIGLSKRRLERHLPSKYKWFKREYELLRDRIEEYFKNRTYEQMTIIECLKDSLKMLREAK